MLSFLNKKTTYAFHSGEIGCGQDGVVKRLLQGCEAGLDGGLPGVVSHVDEAGGGVLALVGSEGAAEVTVGEDLAVGGAVKVAEKAAPNQEVEHLLAPVHVTHNELAAVVLGHFLQRKI